MGEEDMSVVSAMFWNDPSEIKNIRKIVLGFANPLAMRANEIFDGVAELQAKLQDMQDGAEKTALATEANHKFKMALKSLEGLLKQAKQEGKSTAIITERIAHIKTANEWVVNKFLLGM